MPIPQHHHSSRREAIIDSTIETGPETTCEFIPMRERDTPTGPGRSDARRAFSPVALFRALFLALIVAGYASPRGSLAAPAPAPVPASAAPSSSGAGSTGSGAARQTKDTLPMKTGQTAKASPGLPSVSGDGYGWKTLSPALDRQIRAAQGKLGYVYGQLNRTDVVLGSEAMASLSDQTDSVSATAQSVQSQASSYQTVYESYLDIIGAKPVEGESDAIAAQRKRIQAALQDIKSTVTQGRLLGLQAKQMQMEIQRRGVTSQKALLAERMPSPLGVTFWRDVAGELPDIRRTAAPPVDNGYSGVFYRWPVLIAVLAGVFALTALIAHPLLGLLKKAERRIVARLTGHAPDATHRSFIPVTLAGLVSGLIAFALWLLMAAVLGLGAGRSPAFMEGLGGIMPLCGFILGAGLPTLSRVTAVDGASQRSARALWGVDWCVALIVLAQSVLILISQENAFPVTSRRLIEALFVVVVTLLFLGLCRRLSRGTDARMAPAIYGLGCLVMAISWIAIAIGYIAFAFALVVWVVSVSVSLAALLLVALAVKEFTTRCFSHDSPVTRRMARLGVHANRVAQFGVLSSGIVNIALIIVFGAVLLSGGSLALPVIADHVRGLFIGQTINGIQFSLNTAVFCIAILVVAYYAIRAFRLWLENRLFPTTSLDIGARSSILNIFSYVAWILVFLLVLSEAGVTVKNLTWVVSALSVGIGFGLQSIVQNFVSGVILLAERPIRVGDLIELGAVKGDVKRISVRSTEIGLGDGSTMIVPNSQFITSAVRNATLGTSLSAASATVTISPRADATKAQLALMEMMKGREDIMQDPPPGVAISAITDTGITLALSAKVSSVRDVGGVTNAIMLDAYRVLHSIGIELGRCG